MNKMNTCQRCGGRFPTRTSGIVDGVVVCMSKADCDRNMRDQDGYEPPQSYRTEGSILYAEQHAASVRGGR